MIVRKSITVHISPYVGGLAPETRDYIRYLNEEAKRLRTGVSFIALANRILAHGILERALKFTNSLGAWALQRAIDDGYLAHRPQPRWETPAIEGESLVLRRGNSGHRKNLRRYEKNRRPVEPFEYERRRGQLRRPSDSIETKALYGVVENTLYHLIAAIPRSERDREEIYPADFRFPSITMAKHYWQPKKIRLPGFGLRDYGEPTKLLDKFGRYESAWRQKAASPVWHILENPRRRAQDCGLDPSWDIVWRDCEIRLALWLFDQLKTPEEQQVLKRIGRLYKNSCYWSKKEKRCLFDKCWSASYAKASWAIHRVDIDPRDAVLIAGLELQRNRRQGGQVIYLGSPAKRHANLAKTRAAYNEQWPSYFTMPGGPDGVVGLSRMLREARSLNIPRETIARRDSMIANLEQRFGPQIHDQSRTA